MRLNEADEVVRHYTTLVDLAIEVLGVIDRREAGEGEAGAEADAQPAGRGHLFVQEKFSAQGQQYVTQGGGRQHVRQVRPGQGGHVGGEKSQQKNNPQGDPGIQNGQNNVRQPPQGDVTDLLHSPDEKRIADRRKQGHTG